MGSSFSIQSKEKRRRSNRLTKPPQNQATSNCPNLGLPIRPVEQALSLPSTPTTWQNPWNGVSVPISTSEGISSPGVRSQSFSSGPLRRDTWNSNAAPNAREDAQSRTGSGLPSPASPASPTSVLTRRESLYRRASFHPSKPATFQPTTFQSDSQPPLIGQPRRSYSVHSPALGPSSYVPQRALDRFASLNSCSRVNGQDSLPIRRRSLLIRPGVATRKATKDKAHSLISEPCLDDLVFHSPPNILSVGVQSRFLPQQGAFHDFEPLSELRPSTPNDAGYTHLGTLKLGSLRVVNGSASPCPSDRTRIEQSTSPLPPEAMQDSLNQSSVVPGAMETLSSGAMLEDRCAVYVDRIRTAGIGNGLDPVMGSLPGEVAQYSREISRCHTTNSARNDIPATVLNIPTTVPARDVEDFPASPFSFEKSPTSAITHSMEPCQCEDEGISIYDKEKAFASPPDRLPERHTSYSSYASSHRKADSGYSSATSHRTSIDSHASLRRSPGFRRFTLGGGPKDFQAQDNNTSTTFDYHIPMHRHVSLQDRKASYRPDLAARPTSMSTVQYDPHIGATERPRSSSVTVTRTPDRISLPMYCAQLRSLESAALDFGLAITQGVGPNDHPHMRPTTTLRNSSMGDYHLPADIADTTISPKNPSRHSRRHSYGTGCRARSEDNSWQKSPACVAGGRDVQLQSAVEVKPCLLKSGNEFLSLTVDQSDGLRGRTRNRSTEYPHRKPSGHRLPPNFTEVYA
ncbi:hypothetical protein BJX68DRAFT_199595 [Aspergillus pseudodeflectus]|uniref:Uncharacterized protein n=1 Tax=Aspergillus pseudodeflectus TaxID=176178 RepID=A0ABR4JHA1_9EURO